MKVEKDDTLTLGRTRGGWGGGGGGGGLDITYSIRFFFPESVPDSFSTCSFISRSHFGTSLVMDSCYGYDP